MRARMDRERPSRSIWDLKLTPGGFVDIEFIAQALQLIHAHQQPAINQANTGAALSQMREAKVLSPEVGGRLLEAWSRWSDMQQ
jgi:glutamate-ammonia-ligase adenylyltransferase